MVNSKIFLFFPPSPEYFKLNWQQNCAYYIELRAGGGPYMSVLSEDVDELRDGVVAVLLDKAVCSLQEPLDVIHFFLFDHDRNQFLTIHLSFKISCLKGPQHLS